MWFQVVNGSHQRARIACVIAFSLLSLVAGGCSTSPQAHAEKARKLMASGKYAEAVNSFKKAVQGNAKDGKLQFELAGAMLKAGMATEAFQTYGIASQMLPITHEAHVILANMALASYQSGNKTAVRLRNIAQGEAEQMLKADANSFHGLRIAGTIKLLDGDPAAALELLRKADSQKQNDPELQLVLAQAYFQSGDFASGEKMSQNIIFHRKDFEPIYDVLFLQYTAANRSADAEGVLKQRVENNPTSASAVVRLARYYAVSGKKEQMIETISQLESRPQDFPSGAGSVGEFYLSVGLPVDARAAFERGMKSYPDQEVAYLRRILTCDLVSGNRDAALATADIILRKVKNDVGAGTIRAKLLMQGGSGADVAKGLEELRVLAKNNAQDADVQMELGNALMRADNLQDATAAFREALRISPSLNAARFGMAQVAILRRDAAEVLRLGDELVAVQPMDPESRLVRSIGLVLSKRTAEARTELTGLVRENSNNTNAKLQLALMDLADGKYNDAEAILNQIRDQDSGDTRATTGLAWAFVERQQLDKAISLLNDENKRQPDSFQINNLLSHLMIRKGDYPAAIAFLKGQVAKAPGNLDYQLALGDAYRLNEDWDLASAQFKSIAKSQPKNILPLLMSAVCLQQGGKLSEAKDYYKQVLALSPDQPDALNNLAVIMLEESGDADQAMLMVQKCLRASPDNTDYSDTLALVYLKKNMRDPARQILDKLIAKSPQNAIYRMHLATAQIASGDRIGARTSLNTALGLTKSKSEQSQIRQLLSKLT